MTLTNTQNHAPTDRRTQNQVVNPFTPQPLMRADAFAHSVNDLRLLETHISWIVLTGPFAYKIKKPVKFDFVDYSTLARRKHFCELELKLNRRLAPDLYLEVVPITGTLDCPQVGGQGEVLDYAVKMVEFRQDDILAHRIDRGVVDELEMDELANAVARFHESAESLDSNSPFGSPESILLEALKNFEAIANSKNRFDSNVKFRDKQLLAELRRWTSNEFFSLRNEFVFRRDSGATRRCHGDMHLGNIVRFRNRVEVFDGIEFNPALQWIDCLSELAFPLMDLMHHQRRDLAFRLLNVYLEQTGDYAGLAVLRFYLVYRAMVRAKVDYLLKRQVKAKRNDLPEPPAQSFVELASELSAPAHPFLCITHGFSGSGKSTRAMDWATKNGGIRIRSDVERNRLFENKSDRRKYFREMTRIVYHDLLTLAERLVSWGYPVVVDATFLTVPGRERFRNLAKKLQVPFGIIDCSASLDELKRRISERTGDASQATVEVLLKQVEHHEPLTADELALLVVN